MSRVRVVVASALLLATFPMKLAVAEDLTAALTPEELQTVSEAVDRGLQWLSTQQNADGSFDGNWDGNIGPALHPTCFTVMAFLSRGHQPGHGRHGSLMSRAIDFVLSTQRDDGSFSTQPPNQMQRTYAHALSGLTLSEVYASTAGDRGEQIRQAIERALAYSRSVQKTEKLDPIYLGGWYYANEEGRQQTSFAGVHETSWELTFMRSAQNAGFKVPQTWVDEGLEFIARCHAPVLGRRLPSERQQGVFRFSPESKFAIWQGWNLNTTGAGMLALQLHGRREDPLVVGAANWMVERSIPRQGANPRFHYGCYIMSQAMAQAGGKYWESFYPRVVRRLLPHQDRSGDWRLDVQAKPAGIGEEKLGAAYNTALAVLCLTLPDQLLPIHQR